MDEGHLEPFLKELRRELKDAGLTVSEKNIVVTSGRVRAGYAIGDVLFAKADANKPKAVLHIIGERPGSGHHNYSVYIACPEGERVGREEGGSRHRAGRQRYFGHGNDAGEGSELDGEDPERHDCTLR